MRHSWQLVAIALAVGTACVADAPDPEHGAWVGTITTRGNVTTVVSESGSVWVGESRLVVEATIGSEGSPEEYLFGEVRDLATDGERIFVADSQAVVVRVYDFEGRHLKDIGGPGEGPGEFSAPKGVGIAANGQILVQDNSARKIHVFDTEGTYLEYWDRQWRVSGYDERFTVTPGGQAFLWQVLNPEAAPEGFNRGMVLFGSEGPTGTVVEVPQFEISEDGYVRWGEGFDMGGAAVPFVPQAHWKMAPDTTLVAGFADSYHFEVQHPDGSTTVVERVVDAVPVQRAEFDWAKGNIVARARERYPDWSWTGPGAPRAKPFFERLFLGHSGRVWVVRELAGERIFDCAGETDDLSERLARPCWRRPQVFDLFAPDGRFLTTVPAPERLHPYVWPDIDGEMIVVAEEDEVGNTLVKRYRLESPE